MTCWMGASSVMSSPMTNLMTIDIAIVEISICHMTLSDHVFTGSDDFMGGNLSC